MTEYAISEKVRAWATANGYNADLHLDHFNDYLANRTGKPYRDLDAAFRSCVRADWGGLRRAQRVPVHIQPDKVVRANTFVPLPKDTAVPMPENVSWRKK